MTESPDYANQAARRITAGRQTMKITNRLRKRVNEKAARIARLSAIIAKGRRNA